jgi:Mlc titration factor MtfA (ptsG expression regulator)
MIKTIIVLLIIGLIITGIFISSIITKQRINLLKKRLFPPLWNSIIENNLPIYTRLTPDERRRLQGHVQVFLTEKQFIRPLGMRETQSL